MSEGFATPPPPSPGPAPRQRPATVTVASLLILVLVLAALAYVIATAATVGAMGDAFREIYAGTEMEDVAGVVGASSLIGGLIYLAIAITLGILTIFNNQGRNGSRIATWVVGGLGLCCGGLSLITYALGDITAGMGDDPQLPDTDEMVAIMERHLPGWLDPVLLTSNVLGVLALAVAVLLLALPPSNEFFRKPEPHFEPPGQPPVG